MNVNFEEEERSIEVEMGSLRSSLKSSASRNMQNIRWKDQILVENQRYFKEDVGIEKH
jgi:hypothetical protein